MMADIIEEKAEFQVTATNLLTTQECDDLEIELLLQAVFQVYGYDFRHYAKESLHRRVKNLLVREKKQFISELTCEIIHDRYFFDRFLQEMSITVTEMFRDPKLFSLLKEFVISKLQTYPSINIWIAGCATGEEAYSVAIFLQEAGLLERTRIYATDYNNHSLAIAEKGIYPLKDIRKYSENYLVAGGQNSFSDYYHQKYDGALFDSALREKITFAHHNLMKDESFAQMHLVLCRNVMIYFDKQLKDRVLNVIDESLVQRGFLMLGDRESLVHSNIFDKFEVMSPRSRIYQKKLQLD